jgi:hypothetical protein
LLLRNNFIEAAVFRTFDKILSQTCNNFHGCEIFFAFIFRIFFETALFYVFFEVNQRFLQRFWDVAQGLL